MTTIAFDGRYLAADGRMTRGDIICTDSFQKIHVFTAMIRGEAQEVAAFGAGSWSGIFAIMEWMKKNDVFDIDPDLPRPSFPADNDGNAVSMDVAFITKSGELYCLDDQSRPAPYIAPFGEGSGFPFAQMALNMGMSAPDAIRQAIKMDINSGGDVQVFDIEKWTWVDPVSLKPKK